MHGFPAVLTRFIGRAGPVREVAGLLEEYRLVTVTGPGGVGKTRLAGQVVGAVAGRFADGAWLAELAPTRDGAQVPSVVAAALGVREQPGVPVAEVLALGPAQLLDRLDDRFALLAGGDRLAPDRHRSLAATVQWSYQLLGEQEWRVFRAVSVFPGPFTLEAAEAVAGPGAGPVVLYMVDYSLLVPPQTSPDGRSRYAMLETLRAYGARLLAEAGEQEETAVALAGWTAGTAEQAAAGLLTATGEVAAARWLDAEDATMRQALAWAMEHDRPLALRLAVALAPWWYQRGRLPGQDLVLQEVVGRAEPGTDGWCAAQFWLGMMARFSNDMAGALGHFTAVHGAVQDRGPATERDSGYCGSRPQWARVHGGSSGLVAQRSCWEGAGISGWAVLDEGRARRGIDVELENIRAIVVAGRIHMAAPG